MAREPMKMKFKSNLQEQYACSQIEYGDNVIFCYDFMRRRGGKRGKGDAERERGSQGQILIEREKERAI